jgi:hypothetical protein
MGILHELHIPPLKTQQFGKAQNGFISDIIQETRS